MDASRPNNWWRARFGWDEASIDFCEANFELSEYVAEPFNAVSAAPLIGLGVLGARRCVRATRSTAFAGVFALLTAVGLGTVALHATLTAPGQACDEVPMLLLTVALLACIVDARNPGTGGRLVIPTVLAAAAVVVWYFKFQDVYLIFIASYGAMVVAIVGILGHLALVPRADTRRELARKRVIQPLFLCGIAAYGGAGFVAWVTDMLLCDTVSAVLFGGLFLHPVWHCGAALGTWFAVFVVIAARDEHSDHPPTRLAYVAGVLPCVDHGALRVVDDDLGSATTKKAA